jgi:hypothetical protein
MEVANQAEPSAPKLAGAILALVLVGTPVVAYIWETLNHLLSGRVEPLRLLITIPVIAIFYVLLRLVGRVVSGGQAESKQQTRTGEGPP